MTDILDIAREQVLERGEGLDEAQVLEVLRAPRRPRRRRRWRSRTRCACAGAARRSRSRASSASRPAAAPRTATSARSRAASRRPVRAVRLDIPSLVEAARQTAADRRDRVLHRRRRARARRAADGPGPRGRRGDPRGGRHQRRLLAGHPHPRRRPTSWPALGVHRYNHNLETARSHFPQRRHHAHLGGAPGDARARPRARHGGLLRRASSGWARRSSSAPSSPPSSPSSTPTRCR